MQHWGLRVQTYFWWEIVFKQLCFFCIAELICIFSSSLWAYVEWKFNSNSDLSKFRLYKEFDLCINMRLFRIFYSKVNQPLRVTSCNIAPSNIAPFYCPIIKESKYSASKGCLLCLEVLCAIYRACPFMHLLMCFPQWKYYCGNTIVIL